VEEQVDTVALLKMLSRPEIKIFVIQHKLSLSCSSYERTNPNRQTELNVVWLVVVSPCNGSAIRGGDLCML